MHAQMQSRRELFDVYVRDFHQMSGVKEKHLEELRAIDRILEAKARITALVAADLNRGLKSPAGARAKLTAEQTLRLAVLKQLKGWTYRELEERVDQTPALRLFARFYGGSVPDFSTIERAIKRIGPETWQAINDALVEYAVEKKVESGATPRTDTTVIETDIAPPSF